MFRTLTLTSSAKRESCHQSRNGLCMLGWPWFQFDGSFCREAKGRDCKGTHRVRRAKRATLAKRTSWWKLCSLVNYCIICQMGKLTLIWPKLQVNSDFQIGSCQGLWFKRCFHHIWTTKREVRGCLSFLPSVSTLFNQKWKERNTTLFGPTCTREGVAKGCRVPSYELIWTFYFGFTFKFPTNT